MAKSLIACLASFLLFSCTTTYVVNSVHTPLLRNQGEIQAGVNLKSSELIVPTVEPEIAIAITNHIGIMANGSFAFKNANDVDPGKLYHRRNFSEAGLGYFNDISKKFKYEVYAGYGYGSIDERYKDSDDETIIYNSVSYNRWFFQPTIVYRSYLDVAFTPRFIAVEYQRNSGDNPNFTAIEPVVSIQTGKKLILQSQIGYSFRLNQQFDGDYNPLIFAVGVKYCFGRK